MDEDSIELRLGAHVQVILDGRVVEHDGRPVIQTPEGWLLLIPASAKIQVLHDATDTRPNRSLYDVLGIPQ